jgi:hypothetical protein
MVSDKSKAELLAELEEMRRENAELRRQVDESDISAVERRLAVERVRAEAMAMHSSDDLLKVVVVLHQGMEQLGIESDGCNIAFMDEDNRCLRNYVTQTHLRQIPSQTKFHARSSLSESENPSENDRRLNRKWKPKYHSK